MLRFGVFKKLQYGPVKDIIILEAVTTEQIPKKTLQIGVVELIVRAYVLEIGIELGRNTIKKTEIVSLFLRRENQFILRLSIVLFDPLPGKRSLKKI
jgi:hypothetical protein